MISSNVKVPKRIVLAAVLISLFAQLPNIYAWMHTPEGLWFSGFNSYFSPVDINSYFATMRQGFNGSWLWQNRYTAEASSSYPLVFIFYLFLGHLARGLHLSISLVFHLASFVLSIIFLLAVYVFVAHFVAEKHLRTFCFILISLGGGLGWAALGISPDVTHREWTVFPTLTLPHFVLEQILFVLTLLWGFLGVSRKNLYAAGFSAVSGGLLATVHPYALVVADVVLGGYLVLSGILRGSFWEKVKHLLPLFAASVLSLAFYVDLFYLRADLVMREWVRQNVIPSPPFYLVLLSYGLLSLLALFGLRYLWQKRDEKSLFLISWFILHLSIIYLPVDFQLLMIKGFFVVLGLVAVLGIKKLNLLRAENLLLILFFSVLSTLMLQAAHLVGLEERGRLVYLSVEEKAALEWIEGSVPEDSLFLSEYVTGNFLPARTDARSYFGHGIFTTSFKSKDKIVERFFGGKMTRSEGRAFLKSAGIDYIFYGPDEQDLGSFEMFEDSFFSNVYQNEKVIIYKAL